MRDSVYEAWLEKRGVKFDYVAAIRLDDIIIDPETIFNIRLTTSLDDETVLRYGCAIEEGHQFPAILVFAPADGGWGLINGLHRTEALKLAGLEFHDAYVLVEPTDEEIDILRRTCNVPNSTPLTPEASLAHAAHLVDNRGMLPAEAARRVGQPEERVARGELTEKVRELLVARGEDPKDLNRASLAALHLLINRPGWMLRMVQLRRRASLPAREVRYMCQQLIACPNDEAGSAMIASFEEEHAPRVRKVGGGLRKRRTPFERLPEVLQGAEALLERAQNYADGDLTEPQIGRLILQLDSLAYDVATVRNSLRERLHAS